MSLDSISNQSSDQQELGHLRMDPFSKAVQRGEVPESPVVQWVEADASRYGQVGSVEKFQFQEVTFPIYDKTGMYLFKAGRYELDEGDTKPEGEDNRPYLTMIVMGGGSSGALDNMHLALKIRDGIISYNKESKEVGRHPFPARVRVVTLPHIGGMFREIDQGFVDPAKQENLAEAARIIRQAMDVKELGITQDVGFIGASAGGAQVTELAALVGDRCKFLGLVDAGGLAEHPTLEIDFTVGQLVGVVKKYQEKGMSVAAATKAGFHELYESTSTRYGNLASFWDLMRDYTNPVRKGESAHAAQAWGGLDTLGEAMPAKALKADSTFEARTKISAPIIFSPVIYARVVNTILRRVGDKISGVDSIESMQQVRESTLESREEFDTACQEILYELFPNVPPEQIVNLPYDGTTHTAYVEKEYWGPFMEAVAEKL